MITNLGYKVFFTFASVNIGAMAVFSMYVPFTTCDARSSIDTDRHFSMIPETKGRSLEDMDVIFGSVSLEERNRHIDQQEDANDKAAEISKFVPVYHPSSG